MWRCISVSDAPSSMVSPSVSSTWRTGLTSVGIALVANLVVLGVARLAGADMLVQRSETVTAMMIGVGPVSVLTVGPMLLATLLLLPLRRWGARAWHALAVTGLVVALVTVPAPFTMLAEGSTRVALALMHVIAGVVWFIVVRRAARRAQA
ncbi:MAG: DUF6069 family protein [Dermatophilaceae bacterium]